MQKGNAYPHSIISLLDLLNTTHIHNESLLKIISDKLCENPILYKYYLTDILDSFYELGAKTAFLDNLVKKIENEYFAQNPEILFKYLLCKATEEHNNKEFDTLLDLLISSKKGFKIQSVENIEDFCNFLSGFKKNYHIRFLNFLKKKNFSLEKQVIKVNLPSNHEKVKNNF